MSDVLIVGATGLIGRAVIDAFGNRGLTIVARRPVEGLAPRQVPEVPVRTRLAGLEPFTMAAA